MTLQSRFPAAHAERLWHTDNQDRIVATGSHEDIIDWEAVLVAAPEQVSILPSNRVQKCTCDFAPSIQARLEIMRVRLQVEMSWLLVGVETSKGNLPMCIVPQPRLAFYIDCESCPSSHPMLASVRLTAVR